MLVTQVECAEKGFHSQSFLKGYNGYLTASWSSEIPRPQFHNRASGLTVFSVTVLSFYYNMDFIFG